MDTAPHLPQTGRAQKPHGAPILHEFGLHASGQVVLLGAFLQDAVRQSNNSRGIHEQTEQAPDLKWSLSL